MGNYKKLLSAMDGKGGCGMKKDGKGGMMKPMQNALLKRIAPKKSMKPSTPMQDLSKSYKNIVSNIK